MAPRVYAGANGAGSVILVVRHGTAMNDTLRRLVVTGALLGAFSLHQGCDRGPQVQASAAALAGRWRLVTVADQTPNDWNIQQYEADLSTNGTWTYKAAMTGRFAGTYMKGSGSWKLVGDSFEYSAGTNTGRTTITLSGSTLTFSADPIITSDGKTPVRTTYERAP